MDVFPELMPTLLEIKDKYKYDDHNAGQQSILHSDDREIEGAKKAWDKVSFQGENVSVKRSFRNGLIDRGNCSYIESADRASTSGEDRLKIRCDQKAKEIRPYINKRIKNELERKLDTVINTMQGLSTEESSGGNRSSQSSVRGGGRGDGQGGGQGDDRGGGQGGAYSGGQGRGSALPMNTIGGLSTQESSGGNRSSQSSVRGGGRVDGQGGGQGNGRGGGQGGAYSGGQGRGIAPPSYRAAGGGGGGQGRSRW